MNPDSESEIHTALVEIEPGLAVVFGAIPDGLEVSPLEGFAIPDEANLSKAFAAAANLGNVGAQLANGISQAAGLVRLSPATLAALNSGSQPIASGAYNIGVLAGESGKFSAQVMWAPAAAGTALSVAAAAGPAIAMLGIQVQLNQLTKIAEHSLALTGQVLKNARQAEWSELNGLASAIEKAVSEARHIGMVNDAVWDNIRGRESDLNKLEEIYRTRVRDHVSELAKLTDHAKRRHYLLDNGEAILRDASSAFESTNAWLKYQALRASHVRGNVEHNEQAARLAEKIAADAALTYRNSLEELAEAMFALEGELWVMTALPGKRTLPFGGKKAHAEEVARLAATFAGYISDLGAHVSRRGDVPALPAIIACGSRDAPEYLAEVLRWRLDADERIEGVAQGDSGLVTRDVLVLTDRRLLVAKRSELERFGIFHTRVPVDDIRYVRLRRAEQSFAALDLVAPDGDRSWTFDVTTESEPMLLAFVALLQRHMWAPDSERNEFAHLLPAGTASPRAISPDSAQHAR